MKRNPRSFRSKTWVGPDVDLQTSLFEYGFVAVQLPDRDHPDEWLVVYQISPKRFGHGWIREKDLDDLVSGHDWMNKSDIESFLSFVGADSVQDWKKAGFILKLQSLLNYWGYEEIMGSDYDPHTIKSLLRMSENLAKRYGEQYRL